MSPTYSTDLHGFIIRKEKDGEFIYAVRTAEKAAPPDQTKADWYKQAVIKMTLDGRQLLAIPASAIPDQFQSHRPDGVAFMRLSDIAVADNGDLYVSDGYGGDYVHRFDSHGKYVTSFGGKREPYNFSTLHRLVLDTRFAPPRLIATDRAHGRVVHLSLDGTLLSVIGKDMLLPAAIAIWSDYAIIGGLKGPVTVLDKAGNVVTTFGTNVAPDEVGNRLLEPTRWRPGIVAAPHGIAVNAHGDVFVSEFNVFGRYSGFTVNKRSSVSCFHGIRRRRPFTQGFDSMRIDGQTSHVRSINGVDPVPIDDAFSDRPGCFSSEPTNAGSEVIHDAKDNEMQIMRREFLQPRRWVGGCTTRECTGAVRDPERIRRSVVMAQCSR